MKVLVWFNGLRRKQEAFHDIIFSFKHPWSYYLAYYKASFDLKNRGFSPEQCQLSPCKLIY